MVTKQALLLIVAVCLVLLLTGCIPGDGTNTPNNPAGVLLGVWHGWLAPISLIVHFFNNEIRIYGGSITAAGFMILVLHCYNRGVFGGLSLSRRKKKIR